MFSFDGKVEFTEAEAIELRDKLNIAFPPKVGPWRVRKARGGWCVDRDCLNKTPEVAAGHCQNQEMAQRIADMLNAHVTLDAE